MKLIIDKLNPAQSNILGKKPISAATPSKLSPIRITIKVNNLMTGMHARISSSRSNYCYWSISDFAKSGFNQGLHCSNVTLLGLPSTELRTIVFYASSVSPYRHFLIIYCLFQPQQNSNTKPEFNIDKIADSFE
jgi:hypothetical protein